MRIGKNDLTTETEIFENNNTMNNSEKEKIMNENTEYQIYIGCRDPQLDEELVNRDELKETITQFFEFQKISFSTYDAKGGYLHDNGEFIYEDSICINLIGAQDFDIIKFAKSLSMFMNQECSLVVKETVKSEYR